MLKYAQIYMKIVYTIPKREITGLKTEQQSYPGYLTLYSKTVTTRGLTGTYKNGIIAGPKPHRLPLPAQETTGPGTSTEQATSSKYLCSNYHSFPAHPMVKGETTKIFPARSIPRQLRFFFYL